MARLDNHGQIPICSDRLTHQNVSNTNTDRHAEEHRNQGPKADGPVSRVRLDPQEHATDRDFHHCNRPDPHDHEHEADLRIAEKVVDVDVNSMLASSDDGDGQSYTIACQREEHRNGHGQVIKTE